VRLPGGFDKGLAGLKIRKPLGEWQELGVRRRGGGDLPTRQLNASLILAGGPGGPAYLAYNNYRVTLKWNRSTYFALAVGTLAEGIARR
jgi:membrane-bound lytic murein transglycosylase B